jgi:hypothetical protein
MRNPIETFLLFFLIAILVIGLFVTLDAQKELRDIREYYDIPTNINTSTYA